MSGRERAPGITPLVLVALGVTSTFAAVASPATAQDLTHPKDMGLAAPAFERPDPDAMRMELPSGLAAYVAIDDRAPLATLTAFVGAGSAHGEPGDADVLAAALRRGPASMSPGDFRTTLDGMAAQYTVSVGREETEITLDVPSEDAWAAVDLLAAVLRAPNFGTGTVAGAGRTQTAAGGIDYATSLAGAVAAFNDRLFAEHPFGRASFPRGTDSSARAKGQRYHALYYVPSNVVLAVTANRDLGNMLLRVTGAFEDWEGRARPEPVTFPEVSTGAPRQVLLAQADRLQGWAVIGHELPAVPPEDDAALHVMDYILGAYHLDSRLFREAREKRGLTNDNSSFLEPGVNGPGSYTMRTYGRPEVVRLLVAVTFREIERIRETRATDDELFVAKGALVDGLYAKSYATGLDATRTYALEWLRERSHEGSATYARRIAAVTLADVQEMARKYLHPDRMIITVVGPLDAIEAAPVLEGEPSLNAWGNTVIIDGGR